MHSGDLNELRKVVSESTRWILSTAMPIILILAIRREIYPEIFLRAGICIRLCRVGNSYFGQMIKAGAGLIGVMLQMTGEHKVYMKVNIFWGIVNIILNILLVPRYGMIGAAICNGVLPFDGRYNLYFYYSQENVDSYLGKRD